MAKRKALFLDRDGVINVDHGYVGRVEDFEFVEGILELIREAEAEGYLPIVVTNQSGIGRGYYSEADFEKVTAYMLKKMQEAGIGIGREQVFFCPHSPEEQCACRKPQPGMLLEAIEHFGIDPAASILIGDKASDIEAARAAGVERAVLIPKDRPIDCAIL